jgi:predicted membrane protein
MEKFQNLVAKSKLQSLTIVLFLLSFIFTFFAFFSVSGFGVSIGFNLWKLAGTTDLIVFLTTVAAIAANGFILYKVYLNQTIAPKLSMLVTLVSAIVAAFNFVWVLLFILTNNEDEVSLGTGFYLFQLVNLAIAGVNGYKIYQNKGFAKSVMKEAKSEMMDKAKELQNTNTNKPASTTETKPVESEPKQENTTTPVQG